MKVMNSCVIFSSIVLALVYHADPTQHLRAELATQLPLPIGFPTAIYDGEDSIYVFGGMKASDDNPSIPVSVREVYVFSLSNENLTQIGEWSPGVFYGAGVWARNGSMYYFGGKDGPSSESGNDKDEIWRIEATEDDGVVVKPVGRLPQACANIAVIGVWDELESPDGVYYLFGGLYGARPNHETVLNTVWRFSTDRDDGTWRVEDVVTLPTAVYGASVFWMDGSAYILGGRQTGWSNFKNIWKFDSMTNETSIVPDLTLPTELAYTCVVLRKKDAYIVGGYSERSDQVTPLTRFSVPENSIEPIPVEQLPTSLYGAGCVYVEYLNRIYVVGGQVKENGINFRDQILYIELKDKENDGSQMLVILLVSTFLSGAALVVVGTTIYIARRRKVRIEQAEPVWMALEYVPPGLNGELGYVRAMNSVYDSAKFDIPVQHLRLDTSRVLGQGEFGLVVQAWYNCKHPASGLSSPLSVAVKMVRPDSVLAERREHVRSLLKELKILIYVGGHDNVVQVIGACRGSSGRNPFMIVLHLYSHGALDVYLRNQRITFANQVHCGEIQPISVQSCSSSPFSPLSTRGLLQWAKGIADGMNYVSSKQLVHGDLAARNILLDEGFVPKISDFGLSIKLYETNYIRTREAILPWRWMAIETLRDSKFSTWSDVWSFGIVLWELFTLAQVPYPGFSWGADFVDAIEGGYRMPKPAMAPSKIYDIMLLSWNSESTRRPTFESLVGQLKQTLDKAATKWSDNSQSVVAAAAKSNYVSCDDLPSH